MHFSSFRKVELNASNSIKQGDEKIPEIKESVGVKESVECKIETDSNSKDQEEGKITELKESIRLKNESIRLKNKEKRRIEETPDIFEDAVETMQEEKIKITEIKENGKIEISKKIATNSIQQGDENTKINTELKENGKMEVLGNGEKVKITEIKESEEDKKWDETELNGAKPKTLEIQDTEHIELEPEDKIEIDWFKNKEDGPKKTTLSQLQDEIDKLLAPLTPSAVTPSLKEEDFVKEEIIEKVEETQDIDEDIEENSTSSSVSSSPFELCEVQETCAVIETEIPISQEIRIEPDIEKEPQIKEEPKKRFKIGKQIEPEEEDIQVISTEVMGEPSVESTSFETREGTPVPPEEAEALIKIINDHEKKVEKPKVDDYMLASSRLMLRKQLRQQAIGKQNLSKLLFCFDICKVQGYLYVLSGL